MRHDFQTLLNSSSLSLTWNIQQLEITPILFSIIDSSTILFCYYITICDTDFILMFFTSKVWNNCGTLFKASEFFLSSSIKFQVQSSLLAYVRHGCPVARARGSCLKRKTIKLSTSKTIWNILKVRITYTVRKQMEIKLYTRVTIMTAGP